MSPKPEEDESNIYMPEDEPTTTTSIFSSNTYKPRGYSFNYEDNNTDSNHEPSLEELTTSYTNLCDRSKKIIQTLPKSSSPLIRACHNSITSVFVLMENEAHLILQELSRHNRSSCNEKITPRHAILAQRKAHWFLDVVEHTKGLSQNDDFLSSAFYQRLMNIITSVSDRESGAVMVISPWVSPQLAFDVVVADSVYYHSDSVANMKCLKRINSGLIATGERSDHHNVIPIDVEVKAVAHICPSLTEKGEGMMRRCKIEVHRCIHKKRPFSGTAVVGDVSLLLSLSPILLEKEANAGATEICVSRTRMVQVNAVPPMLFSCIDMYTSSQVGKEEITVCLNFQTRRSVSGSSPKVQIELVMSA